MTPKSAAKPQSDVFADSALTLVSEIRRAQSNLHSVLSAPRLFDLHHNNYMPRLAHRLLRAAAEEHPLLPLLLRPCRDLPSARRELQWLTEHAIKPPNSKGMRKRKEWWPLLLKYCQDRGQGKPLQYILGSEWFGPIELKCQPGVLIPR